MSIREELDVLLAIHSTPARRYLKSDPIPDETIRVILDAAIRGPSGGNQQGWGWIVVKDLEVKQEIQKFYLEGWERAYGYQKDEILGKFGKGGFASKVNYIDHLIDLNQIRIDNNHNNMIQIMLMIITMLIIQ